MPATFDMSNPKEAEAYIKNLGVEYRFGCEKENDPKTCHLLADFLDAIERQTPEAFTLYKRNCHENNFPISCFKYAQFAVRAKLEPPQSWISKFKRKDPNEKAGPDDEKPTALLPDAADETPHDIEAALRLACFKPTAEEANATASGPACNLLGQALWSGTALLRNKKSDASEGAGPQDPKGSVEAFTQGCYTARHPGCCFALAGLYIGGRKTSDSEKSKGAGESSVASEGDPIIIPKDMTLAFKHSLHACEQLHHPQSCHNVARMYSFGEGVEKSEERAQHYKEEMLTIVEQLKNKTTLTFTG